MLFKTWEIAYGATVSGILVGAVFFLFLKWSRERWTFFAAGIAALVGFAAWNEVLNETHSRGFNVDAPVFPISWQDSGSGTLVFTCVCLTLAALRGQLPAKRIVGAAALAGILVTLFDIYGF